MVHAASQHHCLFLQITESGSGLACVQHMASRVGDEALVAMRGGGNTRHTLHDIEHRPLDLQQTQFLAIDFEGNISGLDQCTVLKVLLYSAFRVEIGDDFLRHLNTCEYAGVLDNQLLATLLRGRNTTERGVVAVANILLKPNSNQLA